MEGKYIYIPFVSWESVMGISEMPALHFQPSWWLNQTIWKILIRQNWEFIFPKVSGWKWKKHLSCHQKSQAPPWGVTPPAPAALPPPNWGGPGAPRKKKKLAGIFSGGAKRRVSERLCLDFGMFKHLNSWVLVGNENKLVFFFNNRFGKMKIEVYYLL